MASTRQRLRVHTLDAIRALVGTLARSARSVERRTGVTTAQLFVLRQLAESDTLSLSEIADRTLTRQSTVSVVVTRLVAQGLVRRARAADDRRRLELSLTPAGRRLLARAPDPTTGRLLTALDELTSDQLQSLAGGLDALIAVLGVESRAAGMLFEG
ncbi:MAG TPA: MarR family transcriptional regulator [Gemmatimonadaceae bacterium]|nr:MarR family transcriptional regulator [Gemmatimonadaceae bacterium]